jgi:hypothetical protein
MAVREAERVNVLLDLVESVFFQQGVTLPFMSQCKSQPLEFRTRD